MKIMKGLKCWNVLLFCKNRMKRRFFFFEKLADHYKMQKKRSHLKPPTYLSVNFSQERSSSWTSKFKRQHCGNEDHPKNCIGQYF